MRGRQVFMNSLLAHDVDSIFGNPGTTENSVLDSLIDHPELQYYVFLHEGVAVCAANFYAQASGKTGIANLHVAPGLGNGIGMIFGGLKANSPMIITAGQQDTRMRLREPLLSHDLVEMAKPVTKWSAEPNSADEIGPMMQRAFKIAHEPPAGPVFISLPVNVMEQETEVNATHSGALDIRPAPSPSDVEQLVKTLLASDSPAIVAGDEVARSGAEALAQLAAQIGAPVWGEGLRGRAALPYGHPSYRGRLPLEAKALRQIFNNHDVVLMLGGQFFEELWYETEGPFPETTTVIQVENSAERIAKNFPVSQGVVADMGEALNAAVSGINSEMSSTFKSAMEARNDGLRQQHEKSANATAARVKAQWDHNPMSPARAVHEISQALPDNAVIVDETITASREMDTLLNVKDPSDFYAGRGGGIGQGLAGVIGTQVAHPERPIVAVSGDGSAMYSIQALWTAAHHNMPIVFIILSNKEYRVLKHNLDIYRSRFNVPADRPYPHMDLTKPELGFVDMAKGMGVGGEVVTNADDLGRVVKKALDAKAPYLIDVLISGKG
ncbi:MAG: thiamine pyrophosphate-binding protein [Pseudomonadota bacterium]